MRLAYELGRTEEEVGEFTPDEFARWTAFFDILFNPKNKSKVSPKTRRG